MARQLALGIALLSLLGSCGGDEKPSPGVYGDLCDPLDSDGCDTAKGLICVRAISQDGMCTTSCTSDTDCAILSGNATCLGAGTGRGNCYDRCAGSGDCESQLECIQDQASGTSTCKPPI